MIRKGDKVIMNGKYYVSEKNKDKEFIVTTEPTEVCGTLSVWLEGFRGCYAVDGLKKVGTLNWKRVSHEENTGCMLWKQDVLVRSSESRCHIC